MDFVSEEEDNLMMNSETPFACNVSLRFNILKFCNTIYWSGPIKRSKKSFGIM